MANKSQLPANFINERENSNGAAKRGTTLAGIIETRVDRASLASHRGLQTGLAMSIHSTNLDPVHNIPIHDGNGIDAEVIDAEVIDAENIAGEYSVAEQLAINDSELVEPVDHQTGRLLSESAEESTRTEQLPVALATESVSGSDAYSSWVFRCGAFLARMGRWVFGLISLVIGLAFLSAIPILQLLPLGYVLEVSGRIGRSGKFLKGFVGIDKSATVGGIVFGTWVCLLPMRHITLLWHSARLIDPLSDSTQALRLAQVVVVTLMAIHIAMVWACGGRLRQFFWPFIAPFSVSFWLVRKASNSRYFRPMLDYSIGLVSPRMVDDICNAKPFSDWFVPLLFVKRVFRRGAYAESRDAFWDFVVGLRLPYYFWLGLQGFAGGVAWLIIPTLLLVGRVTFPNEGLAILSGLAGTISLAAVVMYLPFVQTHFAVQGRMISLFQIGEARKRFVRAPMMSWLAFTLMLLVAVPLFLLKVARIDPDLLWLPGVMFIVFMLPARFLMGWAYTCGEKRAKKSHWSLTWSMRLAEVPIALAFAGLVFITSFTSWNGAWSLLELHPFLVPAPFFQSPF